ncbi:hypothetical protein M438DRAFT_331073 [Aureobasidium pullulans EXF-150]|uniref:Uncharacterized protein n=1 Tax=Aureobasidium pullulans EXF-150 TaxID=1043002 RepID=A0A074Y7F3_AURPU|nr:uncharacterized protein M438DRAFT_331073 [Aureobasidium pullulans EXF-150]KEQ90127.1 hypothetical protein M438DRAFT_331073 [Aureobasidium pullulans EXF-150]
MVLGKRKHGPGAKAAMQGLKNHEDPVVRKHKMDDNGKIIMPIRKSSSCVEKGKTDPSGSRKSSSPRRSPPLSPKSKMLADLIPGKTTEDIQKICGKAIVSPRTQIGLEKERVQVEEKRLRLVDERLKKMKEVLILKADYPLVAGDMEEDDEPEHLQRSPAFNAYPEDPEVYGREAKQVPMQAHRNIIVDRSQAHEPFGHGIVSRVLLEEETEPGKPTRQVGAWAIKQVHLREWLAPGTVIRALHAVPNNDLKLEYPSNLVRIYPRGPVIAKWRPMIILWHHNSEMTCVPLFTLKAKNPETKKSESGLKLQHLAPAKRREYMPIRRDDNEGSAWKNYGLALHNGPPLIMLKHPGTYGLEAGSFADLSRPVTVGKFDEFEDALAMLKDGSYARLLEAFKFREQLAREGALSSKGMRDTRTATPPALQRMSDDRAKWNAMGVGDDQIDEDDAYYDAEFIDLNR